MEHAERRLNEQPEKTMKDVEAIHLCTAFINILMDWQFSREKENNSDTAAHWPNLLWKG